MSKYTISFRNKKRFSVYSNENYNIFKLSYIFNE